MAEKDNGVHVEHVQGHANVQYASVWFKMCNQRSRLTLSTCSYLWQERIATVNCAAHDYPPEAFSETLEL